MAAPAPDQVTLTDLELISRYSLAVMTNEVDRDELIAVLREDLAWLEQGAPAPSASEPEPEPAPAPRRRAAPAGAAPRRRRPVGGAG